MNIEKLKYPIGKFKKSQNLTAEDLSILIQKIESLPKRLLIEVSDLSEKQLDTPYREDGWSIRQVIHHLADSHMNSFIRIKLALTEELPTIKPYKEELWAVLDDSLNAPILPSLQILEGVHQRWVILLNKMSPAEMKKVFKHPDFDEPVKIEDAIEMYSWHGEHHLAHIMTLKNFKNWN